VAAFVARDRHCVADGDTGDVTEEDRRSHSSILT
jgi:hypothetical protein